MSMKRILLGLSLLMAGTQLVTAQVSNDNEDEVNKVDQRFSKDYVPGQVLVKFKDESTIYVQRTARGQFRAASINSVDELLKQYAVEEMENLYPAEKAKPASQLRSKRAPNGTIVREKNLDKVFLLKMGEDKPVRELVKQLKEIPEVEYAEPNYKVYITADIPAGMVTEVISPKQNVRRAPVNVETSASVICSNPSKNPLYFRQYGITQQKIHQLWNKPIINKKRPVIAILDTGVDINHPDLADNIWTNTAEAEGETSYDDDGNGLVDDVHGWDFVKDYYETPDRNGHGTHCAGIAAAVDNNLGVVGANPLALIMPVKVMSDIGVGDIATICRGITYAAKNGADVISMSFGGSSLSITEKEALDYAYQTSILVASAGNDGLDIYTNKGTNNGTSYPAAYYLVLGVEASGSNLQRASFSNYDPDGPIYSEDGIDGRNYEVQVPGVNIFSTLPGGKYNQFSGTSMSAPLFAGAISALQMVKDYPSKDVLFADLIHLKADFDNIYSDKTLRIPMIDVVSTVIDDNVEGNTNIDGQVDVGEIINFIPVLRNTWEETTDIKVRLSVDEMYNGFVQITTPEVDFGYSLSAYGQAASQTPIQVIFANNIGDNTRIKFTLEISCNDNNQKFYRDVYVTVNNMVKISGLITENHTLTADHTYLVNDNLGVMEGATLTIEPGTRLEFAQGKGLSSFGKLVANGTPEKPIVFTGHNGALWDGIWSHESKGEHKHDNAVYTNESHTLFTLLPTVNTPIKWNSSAYLWYYGIYDDNPTRTFYLIDYLEDFETDMTNKQSLLSDPNYLTPSVLQMLSDYDSYCSQYSNKKTDEKPNNAYVSIQFPSWSTFDNPLDTISYCKFDGFNANWVTWRPYMNDCILDAINSQYFSYCDGKGCRNNIINAGSFSFGKQLKHSNIINNNFYLSFSSLLYSTLNFNNCMNNGMYWLSNHSGDPYVDKSETPSYVGSSREDIVRSHICEMGNGASGFGTIDLSNLRTIPIAEAHGIVWKVCVNGKDAQDEYEDLAPLGVGKHKFEVYFNRPMNKAVAPQISFGVREPYTQNAVAEDGSWNEEGTIYTAYKTITGKTKSDGVNRIYVYGAEDNEFFECPYEKDRFNVMINAAGSMATGFAAEAKMGRVSLTWNNENNDFDDAMGFNIYRYGEPYQKILPAGWRDDGNYYSYPDTIMVADTVCLNREIVDIETTEFTDYDVKPGETYYYYYKVLSTDLKEYDISNVVAATPLTATLGDANGSGDVDVADVITTVNYAAGMEPKPFIFEAADMNTDQSIDILDVIGIIQKILNPSAAREMSIESTATYTIENGTLYVESPVALAGVQVQLNLDAQKDIKVADDLNGFEHTSAWLTDNDYLFLAYNMNGKTLTAGKHALLEIGDANITTLRLSDAQGHNVLAIADETTSITTLGSKVKLQGGIFNLKGQKVSGKALDLKKLPKGVYIINGEKVVK